MRIIPNAEAYQDFEEDGQYYRVNTPHAWYVANLNWGDGTPSDHTDEPFVESGYKGIVIFPSGVSIVF